MIWVGKENKWIPIYIIQLIVHSFPFSVAWQMKKTLNHFLVLATCWGFLSHPSNGQAHLSRPRTGDGAVRTSTVVLYTCDAGYILSAGSGLICQDFGSYSVVGSYPEQCTYSSGKEQYILVWIYINKTIHIIS